MTDSLGRSWQLGTVQLDYNLPERFGLTYTGADNAEHLPVMIHRALFGSFERFIGILIEHTAGELPVWLAPVQAIVLPIADRHVEAAQAAAERLTAAGVRVEVDERTESVGRKIRDAELQKIPYMLVVGDREAEDGTVSVRRHREGDQGTVGFDELAERLAASRCPRRSAGAGGQVRRRRPRRPLPPGPRGSRPTAPRRRRSARRDRMRPGRRHLEGRGVDPAHRLAGLAEDVDASGAAPAGASC